MEGLDGLSPEQAVIKLQVTVIRGHDMSQSLDTTGRLHIKQDVAWAEQHCCDSSF